jgi:DNA adenine methylase Dam
MQYDLFGKRTHDTEIHGSLINYMGNKTRILPIIRHLIPTEINTLIEPFAGSAVISFNTKANHYMLNELSKPVYSIYKYLEGKTFNQVDKEINEIIIAYKLNNEEENSYNLLKTEGFNKYPYGLYIYICTLYAYTSLLRTNSSGLFNVPYGGQGGYNTTMRDKLKYTINYINNNNFTISNKSFHKLNYKGYNNSDYIYIDPPYLNTGAVYNAGWNEKCETELYTIINQIDKQGVKFGYSNILNNKEQVNPYLKKFIEENEYRVHKLKNNYYEHSGISKNAKGGEKQEIFITNII